MNIRTGRLLIVDDEVAQMRALCETLGEAGHTTRGFHCPRSALATLREGEFDLLLTDLMMPEMDGIALVAAARNIDPDIGAIVMTGHGTIDTAVQAMQGGALDYILKPFRLQEVQAVLARALGVQALRRENALLQERERRRSEELLAAYYEVESFSYSISHELRTPLLFVKGFAEMVLERFGDKLGEEGRSMLQVICDGSRNMDQMVNGLLAFSHASGHPLNLKAMDMTAVAQDAVRDAVATHTGPSPTIDVAPLPEGAADPVVIQHVWSNLVSNALKYSSGRAVPHIRISGWIAGSESVYQIEDNGSGFDMRHVDKLFGVFKRLHSAEQYPGAGVGLAIVHRIVNRHGGRIEAFGELDVGARFQFTLPREAPPPQDLSEPLT
jgi:light-regulated signal transduction histidine kinase (bacteriophytochrome)